MAGESKNLLTRTLATSANETMQLYVVYNGHDYRIQLSTLLSLVNKTRLGLDQVNNTSDLDKPLSTATIAELVKKANLADTVTREEWNLFVQQLSRYVTLEQLNNSITLIQQALTEKISVAEAQQLINTALSPITVAITDIQDRLAALEIGDNAYATKAELTSAVTAVEGTITDLDDRLTAYIASNDQRVSTLEARVSTLEENQIIVGPNGW